MGALSEELRLFTTNTAACTRLQIGGEIDLSTIAPLRDELAMIIGSGTGDLDIDMSAVTFCDSTGLCALITAQQQLQTNGRQLRIINPSTTVAHLLALTALTDTLVTAV